MKRYTYTPVAADAIPAGVRFDIPLHCQGQIVEIAYGGFDRAEHGHGDLFRRVTDRSTGRVTYEKRA